MLTIIFNQSFAVGGGGTSFIYKNTFYPLGPDTGTPTAIPRLGKMAFGPYLFPLSFTMASDEVEFEDDLASIPMTVGMSSPPIKAKQRSVTVTGAISSALTGSNGNLLLTATDVQQEVDILTGAIGIGSGAGEVTYNGQQIFVPTSGDRYYIAKPDRPRVTQAEGAGMRYRDVAIPFVCSDPRAYLAPNAGYQNFVPDSDLSLGVQFAGNGGAAWVFVNNTTGSLVIKGGTNYNNAYWVSGTGGFSGFQAIQSQLIPVVPGQTYTVSAAINAHNVTNSGAPPGGPAIAVIDPYASTIYVQAAQGIGQQGTVSATWTAPSGVYWVRVMFRTGNCAITNGQFVTFDSPKFEIGSSASTYTSDLYTPQNVAYGGPWYDGAIHSLPVAPNNSGNYRSYPVILIQAGSGPNVGFQGMNIYCSTPTGQVSLLLSNTYTLLNNAWLIIVCDPIRPACLANPAVCGPHSLSGGSSVTPISQLSFSNTAGNVELFPYMNRGYTGFSFDAGTSPAGGMSYTAQVLWDNVVI